MKRIIATVLTLLILTFTLCGCTVYYSLFGYDEDYTGPLIEAYLSDMPTTFDPMYAYTDESAAFVMSLIYEGLYKYNEDGKVVNALAKSYKKTLWDAETGEFQIEITIKKSYWSDQTLVSADQFVYAWRRILDPEVTSPAASLLYDIKNAQAIKNADESASEDGFMTKHDLGATATATDIIRIDFEPKKDAEGKFVEPDLDAFFEKLASPMLVPVRSDCVSKLTDWASNNGTVYANGPFFLKTFYYNTEGYDDQIHLERNKYYMRDEEVDPIDSYVKPYGFLISCAKADVVRDEQGKIVETLKSYSSAAERALARYNEGLVSLLGYLPLSERNNYKDQVKTYDTLFTHSYYFNTKNPLFEKAEVRQALSMALDRTELANRIVFASAATSVVNPLAFANGYSGKTSFSAGSSSPIKETAEFDAAKDLLKQAGVTSGSFTITVKSGDEVALASAEYCKEVWGKLGFTVTIRELECLTYNENDYSGILDLYKECFYANGEDYVIDTANKLNLSIPESYKVKIDGVDTGKVEGYDVIAVDLYQSSTSAFSTLAQYSKYFSGGAIDLSKAQDAYQPVAPLTSYDNEQYNEYIQKAYDATDAATRNEYLYKAEELLMTEVPVMPLFTQQTSVLIKSNLKGVNFSFGGTPIFTKVTDKDYKEED